jgi:hypothetical protein
MEGNIQETERKNLPPPVSKTEFPEETQFFSVMLF